MRPLFLSLAVLLAAVCAVSAAASRETAAARRAASEEARRLADSLELSPAQSAKVARLLDASAAEEGPLLAKLKERRRRTHAAIRALLDNRQKDAFDSMGAGPSPDLGEAAPPPERPQAVSSADDAHPGVLVDHDTPPAPAEEIAQGEDQPPPPPRSKRGRKKGRHPPPPPLQEPDADPSDGGRSGGVMVDHDTPPDDDVTR